MTARYLLLALALAVLPAAARGADAAPTTASPFVYGSNPAAGAYFEHDGVKLYYEVYGEGPPLLLIHGNGASIWSMKRQIEYFSKHYKVIAMDSRDHGRSGDAAGALTFEAMSDDLAALTDHLHTGPVLVLGWSDGAIEALLLGMRHPDQVTKIAAMAANIVPEGLAPEGLAIFPHVPKPPAGHVFTRAERVAMLDDEEPQIKPEALGAIRAPTLILASDHDLIADEHTLLIYHHIPNAQLAIFPGATHMIPYADPARFNATVDRFFQTPFVKTQRLGDLLKTFAQMQADYAADKKAAGQ